MDKENKPLTNQKSRQENTQDLDQEQKVNANPFQFNSQNVQIFVREKDNYSGKITGVTYIKENKKVVSDVEILLYFGNDTELPVHKTYSDNSGRFIIDNLPSGYYKIRAYFHGDYEYSSKYIKILPCEEIEHSIFLENACREKEDKDEKDFKEVFSYKEEFNYEKENFYEEESDCDEDQDYKVDCNYEEDDDECQESNYEEILKNLLNRFNE